MSSKHTSENLRGSSALKQVFDRYADETVTDEQLRRVMEPAEKRILAGEFRRRRRFERQAKLFGVMAAAAVLIVVTVFTGTAQGPGVLVSIPDEAVPLAGAPAGALVDANMLSGRVYALSGSVEGTGVEGNGAEGTGVEGVKLYLMGAAGGESVDTTVTDENGVYSFRDFPDGIYMLKAALPEGLEIAEGSREGEWVSMDGVIRFTFENDTGNEAIENLDIQTEESG